MSVPSWRAQQAESPAPAVLRSMSGKRSGKSLLERIETENRAEGPISFARFQELALYDPDLGYYTRGARLGREGGDFWTAPEMSPAFGELIGVQIDEMADLLGRPQWNLFHSATPKDFSKNDNQFPPIIFAVSRSLNPQALSPATNLTRCRLFSNHTG